MSWWIEKEEKSGRRVLTAFGWYWIVPVAMLAIALLMLLLLLMGVVG